MDWWVDHNSRDELEPVDLDRESWFVVVGVPIEQFTCYRDLKRTVAIIQYIGKHWRGEHLIEDIYRDSCGRWVHQVIFEFSDEEDWLHASEGLKWIISKNGFVGYVRRHDSGELESNVVSVFSEDWEHQYTT